MDYDALRHFADSWGLVYMFGIFLAVILFLLRPSARQRAVDAAQIPLREGAMEIGHD
ncbi:cbb3-type cytochrome c oxidase subunit 3 [Devosia sp. XK-2]|jgi:cytochrome c oxidase cbb3-type subunit 4|uniref:cbb3-type cytochrome c oxidase subunit 3 n=1 Tax=Devosia sp. XK-2 TaxID=3126689 RepID=UPI0030CA7BAB